jgi:predicted Zn-dependent protease with MMP-like domain
MSGLDIIQANPKFINEEHFQDLVDIINSHELDYIATGKMIREISHFIGFKDNDMQRIAEKAIKNPRHNILS